MRTTWKRTTALIVGCATVMSGPLGVAESREKESNATGGSNPRPNVLLVVTDDQRQGMQLLPRIRRLVLKRGREYPHAYATTPLCCPSRASIFTGKYSHNHGVVDNFSADEMDPETTVQYYLQKSGYRTGLVGKFLNRWQISEKRKPDYFTDWAALMGGGRRYYYNGKWNVNGEVVKVKRYATEFITRQALRFLKNWEAKDTKPWFLVVTPTAPHSPFTTLPRHQEAPVPPFRSVVEKDKSDKPDYVKAADLSPAKGARKREKQLRSLMPVDDLMNRILLRLRRSRENADTVVVFMSDNGMMWGEHGLSFKHVPYTEAVNVPLFIKWPGRIDEGSVDDRLVGNIDIAPTILDAAGMGESAEEMDGASLLDESWSRDRIHLEYASSLGRAGEWASTRTDEYQYVEYYGDDGLLDFREYYDLQVDPDQLENYLGDQDSLNDPSPLMQAQLEAQLRNDRSCAAETCP